MSMTQLIIGAALGYCMARGTLLVLRQLLASHPAEGVRAQIGRHIPANWISGFTRYAALVGASVALVVLGVWAVSDYMAARAARTAAASTFDVSPAPALSDGHSTAEDAPDAVLMAAKDDLAGAPAAHEINPYADPDFKVRRSGGASLKDKLLQRAEAKAGNELLRDMKQHARRSQYDCESAEHAGKYLKAGLDVWGFASWQSRHFPMESYTGATLEQCQDIKNVVEPTGLDLKSTVAQGSHS